MTVASFQGSPSQQELADEVYRLMTTQGSLFAIDAPIRQSLDNLADYLAGKYQRGRDEIAADIDAALQANEGIFAREETERGVLYVTSRQGAYVPRSDADTHSFRQRLHEPENPLPIDDISVVVSTSRPAITTVEPVFISDYWQVQAGMAPLHLVPSIDALGQMSTAPAAPVAAEDVAAAPELVIAEPEPVAAEPVAEPDLVIAEPEPVIAEPEPVIAEPEPVVAEPEPVVAEPEPVIAEPEPVVAEPEPVVAKPEPVVAKPPRQIPSDRNTVITLAEGLSIDLRRPIADILAEQGERLEQILSERIDQDPLRRIVSFGRSYYPEASVVNLGKNDLRKIRDYILERNEPLSDTEIIADLYYHNPRQADYEGFRFSLNYRLHREKDFEFVGVEGARLWSTKGLPAISGKRVKAAEMGQITSYLVEGYDNSLEGQSAESISKSGTLTRLLTFFEWEYGVLPFDASITALVPTPMLPDQRSAMLRFESPQHYTSYLVEVRYPTGNRGGWLQGLEEFFREHLVPGAMITIARGSEPNLFTISYEEAAETEDRLLTLDEKKNKFSFANLTYFCAVDADQVPSQSRYGKLKNLKSLPMGERRKSEVVLEHIIEVMGEQVGSRSEPRYSISMDDLLLSYNVLRPGSRNLLEHLLENGEAFSADEANAGRYTFTPPQSEGGASADEPEDSGEGEDLQPARRRFGRYTDDDE
ncbi:hypothetical protein K2Z83_06090 [Oscillochloris sp. ZM17-4]|uniref:hypothetical protein n=1 Tax=Oscillochloris sp. ZM17-4 TaxID=2866714 RepID=UPI001C738BA7|nr:hypothetical protein [Oscillochloris sp. ZM17-4]MBX0327250.1 hypothetical protein [Oscillochloris sp. ZM17-4]